jgi:hypothetical protein
MASFRESRSLQRTFRRDVLFEVIAFKWMALMDKVQGYMDLGQERVFVLSDMDVSEEGALSWREGYNTS